MQEFVMWRGCSRNDSVLCWGLTLDVLTYLFRSGTVFSTCSSHTWGSCLETWSWSRLCGHSAGPTWPRCRRCPRPRRALKRRSGDRWVHSRCRQFVHFSPSFYWENWSMELKGIVWFWERDIILTSVCLISRTEPSIKLQLVIFTYQLDVTCT